MTMLGLRTLAELSPTLHTRLNLQRDRGQDIRVHKLAAYVLDHREASAAWVILHESAYQATPSFDAWESYNVDDTTLELPMLTIGSRRWALVPLDRAKVIHTAMPITSAEIDPYDYYYH